MAGSKTVEELDDEALRLLAAMCASRAQYVAYLVAQLAADKPIAFVQWQEGANTSST